jgi:hypothetical protein
MRTLILLAAVGAMPAFAAEGEAPKVEKVDYKRLINADVAEFSVDGMPRTDLMKLRFQLQEQRPGLISPLAMLSGGGVLAFLGLGLIVTTAILSSEVREPFGAYSFNPMTGSDDAYVTAGGIAAITGGIVMVLAGAALIVFGGLHLSDVLPSRRAAGFKMNLIDTELDKLGPAGPQG